MKKILPNSYREKEEKKLKIKLNIMTNLNNFPKREKRQL